MEQYIRILTSNLRINDAIDVIIITFLVYKLLGLIRSSRAEQLAKGIAIILVVAFFANLWDMYAVTWILDNLFSVGLVALVVVFQPELRRALEYLGRGKFTSKTFSSDQQKISALVRTITSSVEYFSARKEGALIVIERETALQDVAETGTILDSVLSEEALENLFYKGSPLHDGAVILRADRIFAAGCVLPLTSNQNLSKDLGTRHRAAIGISEVSDAVVLVVSEETGIISMAKDGKLSRFLDLKTVDKYLTNMYSSDLMTDESFVSKVKDAFKNGFGGKKDAAE